MENALGSKAGFKAYLSSQQELTASLAAQGIRLESVVEEYDSWHEKTTTLAPAARMALSIAVSWATAGAGLAVDFGTTVMQQAMTQAVNGIINQVILSGIEVGLTGNSDLFDVESILKSAALSAATSFIGGHIELKYNSLSKVQVAQQVTKVEGLLKPQTLFQKIGSELPKRLIKGSVRAGLSTAVNGGNLGDNLKAAVAESVIMSTLAGVQSEIGDLNLEEGSFNHALLHGIAGCAAAEASKTNCAAGAASAVAQSVYAGYFGDKEPVSSDYDTSAAYQKARKTWFENEGRNAELVGAIAGFAFSSGKGENVQAAAMISRSGAENNYLSHGELFEFEQALRKCIGDGSDCASIVADYRALSALHDEEFRQCQDSSCIQMHLTKIAAAEVSEKYNEVSYLLVDARAAGLRATFDNLQFNAAEELGTDADAEMAWHAQVWNSAMSLNGLVVLD